LLQKTSSQISEQNLQNSLNPAAFEPSQLSKVSLNLSLGTEQTSPKMTSSSQALTTFKAPDMSAPKASSATAPESKNGPDCSCVIGSSGSSEPKQQQSQGDSTTVLTEQLNPLYPSGIAEETWLTNGMRHFWQLPLCSAPIECFLWSFLQACCVQPSA